MDEELIKKSIARLEELHKDSKRLIDGLTEVCDNEYVEDAIAYITANEEIEKFIGSTVYVVYSYLCAWVIIAEEIVIKVESGSILTHSNLDSRWNWHYLDEIGTKVFLTREAAEERAEVMKDAKTD
jgi:hypothetical protein